MYIGATTQYCDIFMHEPTTCRVVELPEPPLYEKYTVYLESSQTSPDLVDNQCQENVDCSEGQWLNTKGGTIESWSEETVYGWKSDCFHKECRGLWSVGHENITSVSTIDDDSVVPAQTLKWEDIKSTAVVPYIKDLGRVSLVYCYLQYCAKARDWLNIFHNWLDVTTLNAYQVNRKFRDKKKGLMFRN